MPKLVRISGKDLLTLLLREGFVPVRQKGSHVRITLLQGNDTYRVTIPLHSELDRGTLKSILRSLDRCLPREKITEIFYK